MNRKERRAAQKADRPAAGRSEQSAGERIHRLFYEAAQLETARKFDDAARAYKRVLALDPAHAQAWNNLGRTMQQLGKREEASTSFAKALALLPQLLEQYAGVRATLLQLSPALAEALLRQDTAWPKRLSEDELFDSAGIAAIESDPDRKSV